MYGQAALSLKMIVDQHFITTETLQAFDVVVNGLFNNQYDFSKIFKAANFKTVLKELNAQTNGIFV